MRERLDVQDRAEVELSVPRSWLSEGEYAFELLAAEGAEAAFKATLRVR